MRYLNSEYPQFSDDKSDILKIEKQYSIGKKNRNLMDYDDLLINMVTLLTENDTIRRKTFKYL